MGGSQILQNKCGGRIARWVQWEDWAQTKGGIAKRDTVRSCKMSMVGGWAIGLQDRWDLAKQAWWADGQWEDCKMKLESCNARAVKGLGVKQIARQAQ